MDELLSGIDLFPTLCGLCGVAIPEGKDGRDLSHVLLNRSGPSLEHIYIRYQGDGGGRGIRTKRYTYAVNTAGQPKPWLLYDNVKDPYQMNNLVGKPESRELLNQMHQTLLETLKDISDPAYKYKINCA